MRPAVLAVLSVAALLGPARASTEKPAASLRDMRDHFAGCFQPPGVARNTRIPFYFSMNGAGGLIGRPRTTWLGYTGPARERAKQLDGFDAAFAGCLPVVLDRRMAASLPGEVYYLQYVVGPDGRDEVLFRPFGSHGDLAPRVLGPREPLLPETPEPPPLARPAPAFVPQPMHGPVFDPPLALPRGRSR